MNDRKILSGYDIVEKGATKIEATLPELGIKDIFPAKTWLENKQIQAALEVRKHLIEVERIDKRGVLSHAEWREELMLAEVTQQVGSYWQYLGHTIGKKIYLRPEEALFLLEINSLSLKHNNVRVSLQQAYILLLRDKITLLQYKVYASLSRLGYRVYRHTRVENITSEKNNLVTNHTEESVKKTKDLENNGSELSEIGNSEHNKVLTNKIEEQQNIPVYKEDKVCTQSNLPDITCSNEDTKKSHSDCDVTRSVNKIKPKKKVYNIKQLQKFTTRQIKPCNNNKIHKYFHALPELLGNNTVTIKVPDKHLLPGSIDLNKLVYKINLKDIQIKNTRVASTDTNIYNVDDEANGSHIRRLRNTINRTETNWIPRRPNMGFATQNAQFRPFHGHRPRQPFNYFNVNMLFQRHTLPNWFFVPNTNFFPRPQPYFWRSNTYINNRNHSNYNRKQPRKSLKQHQLDGILNLTAKLKQLLINGNAQEQNIYSLQRLIQMYNTKHKTKLRLNETFDLVDETVVETIVLEADEGPSCKKRRTSDQLDENLKILKSFAFRLKELEYADKSSGRHRRAFSKLLKTFNETYVEDYYLDDDYEVVCRNRIDLDSSEHSESDCAVEEQPTVSGKKLKNPFNILKRLSEVQSKPIIEASSDTNERVSPKTIKTYSKAILDTFTKGWLPAEGDFGRAEVIIRDIGGNELLDIKREEFLYDFIKIQPSKYDNWLKLKKSFFNSIEAAIIEFQGTLPKQNIEIDSIVKPEDCGDMASVLKKLRVIQNENKIKDTCKLTIHLDVYNRDVQNFKKSNRPAPHFRIICINEQTSIPSGDEIASLHSQYTDKVAIVFAIVGNDSISYIQMNPTNLPVYISNNM